MRPASRAERTSYVVGGSALSSSSCLRCRACFARVVRAGPDRSSGRMRRDGTGDRCSFFARGFFDVELDAAVGRAAFLGAVVFDRLFETEALAAELLVVDGLADVVGMPLHAKMLDFGVILQRLGDLVDDVLTSHDLRAVGLEPDLLGDLHLTLVDEDERTAVAFGVARLGAGGVRTR